MKKALEEIIQLYDSNQLEEAERIANDGILKYPEDADFYFFLAKIFYKRQEWGKAINQFQEVLEIDAEYPGVQTQIDMTNAILGYYTPDMFNP